MNTHYYIDRMKQIGYLIVLLIIPFTAHAQLAEALEGVGFENIRVADGDGRVTACFEDNIFRSTYRGVGEAIRTALQTGDGEELELVALDNGVPRLYIRIPQELAAAFRDGRADIRNVYAAMELSYDTDKAMERLTDVKYITNSSRWKTDFVVYPGVILENFRLDRIYSYAVMVSPALELSPWKGAKLTVQGVFPIATNMQGEPTRIRPGVVAIRQDYRLPRNFLGYATAGNFTDNRYGFRTGIGYRMPDGRVEVGVAAGATAYAGLRDGKHWYMSNRFRMDATVGASAYEPYFNLQFDLRATRYVFGDMGIRADCTRHFGECAIGVYGMLVEGIVNGGFHFTVPLPGKKWNRRHAVRLRPASYFAMEYSREDPGRYMKERMGTSYETRPDENRSEHFFQPEYIRHFLLNEK